MRLFWRPDPCSLLAGVALAAGVAFAPAPAVAQAPATAPADHDKAAKAKLDQERAAKDKAEKDRHDREKEKEKEKPATPEAGKRGSNPTPPVDEEKATEDRVLALVGTHLPELAQVLGPLKTSQPTEYRKAIAELAKDARSLAETQGKNPARYPFALDSWKARTRVELIAAQLARAPAPEREKQLRDAIRDRVEADIRRNRFELDQAEAAVRRNRDLLKKAEEHRDRARAALVRAEESRDGRVEARFQALFGLAKKPPTPPPPPTAAGPMPHPASPLPHD